MKSDRVSKTSIQIPSTDEIMPDLNHSGIHNTQKQSTDFMCENLYLNPVVPNLGARMSDNKQS